MLFRKLRNIVEYAFFAPVNRVAQHISFRSAGKLGDILGTLAYRVLRFRRAITLDNLRHAFPEKGEAELSRIAAGTYRGYARAVVEMLWAGGADEAELKRIFLPVNRDVPLHALARGKGLILLSGHFGSWELTATSLGLQLGNPVVAIAQPQRNPYIDRAIHANRNRFGNGTVTMRQSVREVIRLTREGRIVAMLGDQSGPKEGVFVEFFGRPAATHRGPAMFSLKNDIPIVMYFILRQRDGTYKVEFEELDRSHLVGTAEEKILELTRRHTALLERYIRRYPDHWLWMHKRWKHTAYYREQMSQGGATAPGRVA
jgi:KDO2-lipid IV(A) lauroyltransferase